MAQNWVVTRQKRLFLAAIDILLWPLSRLDAALRGRPIEKIDKILVLEFWYLGDAVLAEPFLRGLRRRFPAAEITLLCKAPTRTLLEPSNLVDRFIVADIPWTAFSNKYAPGRYLRSDFAGLIRRLRSEHFDLTIDARMDVRSNLLTRAIGARRRVGFDVPGGRSLLTDRVPPPGATSHKVDDWLALLGPIGGPVAASAASLRVADTARASAGDTLAGLGLNHDKLIVGVHPSARQIVRRWPIARFRAVLERLAARDDVQVLVIQDPDGYGEELADMDGVVTVRPALDELMALLECMDLFIGNDSGPAHIAAAVGTPTVVIFGSAVSAWYRPLGEGHRVIQVDDMPCRPCFDQCTRSENFCITDITVERVLSEVDAQLQAIFAEPLAVDLTSLASDIPG